MQVSDIMTRQVISVTPETAIADAAQLLLQHRISGLPVLDRGGTVVGVVTEGDLLRRAETGTQRRRSHWLEFLISPGRLASEYADANARLVGEVMTSEVVSVTPTQTPADAVELMERRHVKRLPVIEAGRLVGMLSRADLVRALVQSLATPAASSAGIGDAEIREQILSEIVRQPWGPRASVDVTVTAGVVELHGSITDERERTALKVLAEKTPGVVEVRDNLVWIEPMSGIVIPAPGSEPPNG